MPISKAYVVINSPIEKVFDAIADPEKMTQYASSSVLTGSSGNPDEIGSYAEFDYHVLGMTFHARMTVTEVEKPGKLIQEMSGAMPGKWTWDLEQAGQTVKVDFGIEYTLPGGFMGKIANKLFLGRMNQKNVQRTLNGLKAYCET